MFRFAHPEYLYGFYFLALLVAVFLFLNWDKSRKLRKFANTNMHSVIMPFFSRKKEYLKQILFLTALAFLILTAANPQVGTRIEEVKQTGIDIMIALDVSRSMKAEDIRPNRLEKAKIDISSLINKLQGNRIGLVVFAGDAFLQFPLTTDYSAASLFLSVTDENTVPEQGTAIAAAIEKCISSFDTSSTQKSIIIISDGENHEGNIDEAIKDAVDKGIKIYCIGLGSPEGAPIPESTDGNKDYKKDASGNVIMTKLNEEMLKKIASEGKGKYYLGSSYEDHLTSIYNDLSELEKSEFGVKKVTEYEDRYYYFLIPALILLLIEVSIGYRKSSWLTGMIKKLGLEK
ncbi:MAG TPA: VWA domain-containing protein [Ignavibacteriaceae bacterium]|nr:VWA domain-containing protein [Ignavibacteriaceae bacterium]